MKKLTIGEIEEELYKELDFEITILQSIVEKIKKSNISNISNISNNSKENNEIYRNVDVDIGTKTEAIKYRNVTIELTNNFMKIFNGKGLYFIK